MANMGKSWATGFFGTLLMGAGSILVLMCLLSFAFGGTDKTYFFSVLAIALIAVGSYLRYLSSQTVRTFTGDDVDKNSSNVSVTIGSVTPGANDNHKVNSFKRFEGEDKSLANDAFKLYLVNTFKISKNEVFNKFTFNEKLYDSLDDALVAAKTKYEEM
jgi:hypothetical protein